MELHFAPYVYPGTRFPPCEFEQPAEAAATLGRHTLRVDFYNAAYEPVTSAETPGRYGAIVTIETEDSRVLKRFRTLFRKPDRPDGRFFEPRRPTVKMSQPEPVWYGRKGPLPVELPPDLGIDPEVVREQGTTLYEYFRGRLLEGYWNDPWTAILLAGLYETRPGEGDIRRKNAWERDRRWWAGLKQRTGDLRVPHLIYLPPGYDADAGARWPLVLDLHGSGAIGDDLDQVREGGLPKVAEAGQEFPFILLAPQSPEEEWFWSPAALGGLLDDVCARHRVDPDRILVTGASMGGRGAWVLAIEYPERFAGIAPICGSIPELEPEELARIRHLPVWAFLGAKDHDHSIQRMVEALQALGGNARLTVYPDAGHDAWTPTYADSAFTEWLLAQRRVRPGE